MSESSKKPRKAVKAKSPKAVKVTESPITAEDIRAAVANKGPDLREMVRAGLAMAGVSEQEVIGMVEVGMKYGSKMVVAQEAAIARDQALTGMANSVSTLAGRMILLTNKLETALDSGAKVSRQAGSLILWLVDLLDANKVEIHEAINAVVWAAGLKGVAETAVAQGGDPEASKAKWAEDVAARKAAEVAQALPPAPAPSGTRPVKHHGKHKGGKPHTPKDNSLKATIGDRIAAKAAPQAEG